MDFVYKLNEFDYLPGSFLSPKAPFLGSGSLRSRRLEVTDEGKNGVLEGAFRPEGKMCRQQILHSITFNTIRAKIWKAKDCLSDPVNVVAKVSRNGSQSILGFKASSNDMSCIKI